MLPHFVIFISYLHTFHLSNTYTFFGMDNLDLVMCVAKKETLNTVTVVVSS